jgi:hypothetical protein
MNLKQWLSLSIGLAFGAAGASAGTISYTCAANIDATVAGTCNTLNTTIAALYGSTFSNANASIYIQYGTTGLGESTQGFTNQISYATYRADLAATASGNPVDAAALASLPLTEPAIFNGAPIDISSAEGEALGVTGLTGTTSSGQACFTPGVGGCYNGIITITNPADLLAGYNQTLFYRNGVQDPDSYDFYTVVEHETDEVLGTSSCISTTGGTLTDGCSNNAAAAVDLFRYNGGSRVFIDTTPGAYLSFDGGATNGAGGAIYNTLANGNDYSDFASNCQHVQDATGCLGQSFDITNDGGSEVNTLDVVGYNLSPSTATPEPATIGLFGAGLAILAAFQHRRRA